MAFGQIVPWQRFGVNSAALVVCTLAFSLLSHEVRSQALANLEPAADPAIGPANAIALAPGEFVWHDDVAAFGDVLVSISLDTQQMHVYRNGALAGVSTISSGREGYETPRGVYTILQKKRKHRSNLYDDAPMPFMQRLTWDGLALHAGRLPGYPASHGCIRLPKRFAKLLYAATTYGTTVIVANDLVDPKRAADLGLIDSPVAWDVGEAVPLPFQAARTTAELNRAALTQSRTAVR